MMSDGNNDDVRCIVVVSGSGTWIFEEVKIVDGVEEMQ